MTENDDNNELGENGTGTLPPQPLEADKSLVKTVKRAMPFVAGILAFLVGLLLLAPLESYAYLALRQLAASGVHVDITDLSLSAFGRFKAEGIKIPIGQDPEKQTALKIAEAKGKVSLLDLLSDKYDSTLEAVIISFSRGDLSLKVDSIEFTSVLEQAKGGGTTKVLNGNISLQATAAQVTYKETKYLKEEIVIPFLQVTFKLKAQQNTFTVETGEAMGRLVNAQVRGSFSLGQQQDLNLNIVLKLTNEFFEKYQDKDPRTLLKFAGILQDDGRIEFNIRGTTAQPIVEPVKAITPGAPPQ